MAKSIKDFNHPNNTYTHQIYLKRLKPDVFTLVIETQIRNPLGNLVADSNVQFTNLTREQVLDEIRRLTN